MVMKDTPAELLLVWEFIDDFYHILFSLPHPTELTLFISTTTKCRPWIYQTKVVPRAIVQWRRPRCLREQDLINERKSLRVWSIFFTIIKKSQYTNLIPKLIYCDRSSELSQPLYSPWYTNTGALSGYGIVC